MLALEVRHNLVTLALLDQHMGRVKRERNQILGLVLMPMVKTGTTCEHQKAKDKDLTS